MERAVGVAAEVAAEGSRGSNAGGIVDEVLKRIAEKSADGRFEEAAAEADVAFARWERDETERRDAAIAGGLKILEAGLRQDILRRDPMSAAKRIERIVALEHPGDPIAQSAAMAERGREWHESGHQKGLNLDLQVSIEIARLALDVANGSDERGVALNRLGICLARLGERESGTTRLDEAVESFRSALQEHSRERVPRSWAGTQNNLGLALAKLGERQNGTARLDEAVHAFRAALHEVTREREPLDWAVIQNNLGLALTKLGERESDTKRLNEAVEAYRNALQEQTREIKPLGWAMTQNNLGNALAAIGERRNDPAKFDDAIEAYRAALQEYTRERVPLGWAMIQNNLGSALHALGSREDGTGRLYEALQAYQGALQERTRERAPLDWATTQNNLGVVFASLGDRERDPVNLELAIERIRRRLKSALQRRLHTFTTKHKKILPLPSRCSTNKRNQAKCPNASSSSNA